jgi:peptidyl-prolyl cis-trans isomerase A (cyclophilin A)
MNKRWTIVGAAVLAWTAVAAPDAQVDLAKVAKLRTPSAFTEQAPPTYKANLETSKGTIVIEVRRDWAPIGADRFFNLVKGGFYDGVRFFRVIPNFMAQFGIHGNPAISAAWRGAQLRDDPVKQSNKRGYVSFATGGPNTRTTQLFINFKDNGADLDKLGFAPIGQVVTGMDVVDKLYSGYGEGAPRGRGPDQIRFQKEGNAYLEKNFPQLDYIKSATIAQ